MTTATRLLTVIGAAFAVLLPLAAHADEPDDVTWTLTVDGPTTVVAGAQVALHVERSVSGPAATLGVHRGATRVRDVPVGAYTKTYRAIVTAPTVKKTKAVKYRLRDEHGVLVASTTVTVTPPAKPKTGPNGYRRTTSLDRQYLIGRWRWSPCRAVPIRVTNKRLVAPTRKAARDLRAHTGLRLRVTKKPLRRGFGIRVRIANLPGDEAGRGGPRRLRNGVITRGRVRIDLATARGAITGVMAHELAHALGVGHAPHPTRHLMSSHGRVFHATAWDRAALRYAGQGAC